MTQDQEKEDSIAPSGVIPLAKPTDHSQGAHSSEKEDPIVEDVETGNQTQQCDEPPYSVFSHREKATMILIASFTAVISPLSGAIYLPAIPSIARDLSISTSLVNLTVTTYLVLQGVAPSFIANFSDVYGRRPAYMICCIIYLAANIGLASQNTFAALITLRCLQSCGSSATVALGSAVAADLATRAERGKYLGYAAMGITLGPALGPVIGGLIDQYLGWRSIFWFLAILSGVLFIILFIFLPETCRNVVGNGSVPSPWWNMSLLGYIKQRRQRNQKAEADNGTIKPSRKRPNPFASLKILAEKEGCITLGFGSIMYGGYYMLLTTLSSELSSRFGFSSVIIGLCYLPLGVGSLLYRHTGGFLLDWNFRRHSRATGIVITHNRQQDVAALPIEKIRLEISLPFVYLACLAIVAYGWTMQTKAPLVGIEISLFFCGLLIGAAVNGLNTLIVDTHVNMPATAVAANNLCRCLVGAAAAAIGGPLTGRIGIGWTSVFIVGVVIFLSPLLWLVMAKGPTWRQAEKNKENPNTEDDACR
ncbi:MFS general substrate transporter [Hypoxylon trugodes]|uniref:MFS general substrate transporter n=1 Tax=Hypoxylon trugodes TaxID=326681 RepID=UPI0021A20DBB|nr:MFS general substrate transporter [Hypoxylon trugodes]KAI1385401.1 MFS general substrate transporter [Hypoxylon trugodes]